MGMQNIYHLALVGHILGLTIMAGTTLVDYILFKQLWKQYAVSKPNGLILRSSMAKYRALFGIGIILLIISGITMMGITNGIFGEQLWFRIKFGLVLLIIINGLAIGGRQGKKLNKLLSEEATGKNIDTPLAKVKGNINIFQLAQMLIFLTIFVLSVFKFN
jgi:hypothetical protein